MTRFIPQKLVEIGLKKYLDATVENHNDRDYEEFIKLFNQGVNKSNLGRIFGVGRHTIIRWIKIYEMESSHETAKR